MSNMPITVPEFVKVRQHIANLLKENSSTQLPTRIRQAENLLMAGVIDVQAVLDEIAPKPTPVDVDRFGSSLEEQEARLSEPQTFPLYVDEEDD